MKRKHIWKRFLTSVIALAMVFAAVPSCSGGTVFATEAAAVETDITEAESDEKTEVETEEETGAESGTEEETRAESETEEETEAETETEEETEAETEAESDAESGTDTGTEKEEETEAVTDTESGEGSTDVTDGGAKRYTVTLKQAEGGTLTLKNADGRLVEENVYSYEESETITVVIEDSDYLGFRLVMETSDGEVFADSWEDEYTARFTMPAEDVSISVDYYEPTEEELAQAVNDAEMISEEEASSSVSLFSAISVLGTDEEYATYKKGKIIYYAGYNTRYRTLDGNEAYCLQPAYDGPANGTYLKRYDIEDYITVTSGASEAYKAELLRIAAYYSYGCPGFDKSMWPDTWYDGTEMTAARYYVLAHIMLAELYTGTPSAALSGTTSAFQTYYRYNVSGWMDGEKLDGYEDTTRGKIEEVYSGDGVTDAFVIYLIVNSGYQDILGWEYAETGGVYVYKFPEDEDVYEDNDYYSLEGAEYGVYEFMSDAVSDTNRKETLTTTSTGKSNKIELVEGTYYVKEVTASEGFDLDTTTYTIEVTEDKTTKVTSTEPMHTGKITVAKTADDSGVLNVSTTVKGAVYGIYDEDGDLVEEITTDSNGTAVSGKLYFGDYTVKEISAPDGYWVDDTEYEVSVKEEETYAVDSTDKAAYGYIEIYKYSDSSDVTDINSRYDLSGAKYGIYNSDGDLVQTLTTTQSSNGKYGYAKSGELALGTYTVKETMASEGFDLDTTTYKVKVTAGSTSTVTYVQEVASTEMAVYDSLTITLTKIDSETGESAAEGDASLAGAQFTIRYYDTTDYDTVDKLNAAIKSGELEESDAWRTWVIETKEVSYTDSSGKKVTQFQAELDDDYLVDGSDALYYDETAGTAILPIGTIVVEETAAPEGYLLGGMSYTSSDTGEVTESTVYFSRITQDGSIAQLTGGNVYSVDEVVIRGGVRINKRDSETLLTTPQGDATLEGAVFNIVNKSEAAVVVNGKSYDPGEIVMTITTDEDGLASTASDALPYGTYQITEVTAPTGYLNEGTISQTFEIQEHGVIVDMTAVSNSILNDVIRGGVEIYKRDLQSGDALAEGGATLGGAVFEITNMSKYAVMVDGTLYDPGEVVLTLTTDDAGYTSTSSDALPYGTYRIDEVQEPEGYLPEGVLTQTFEVREDGVIVDMTAEEDSILNLVKRGDFEFTKADGDSQERMANVRFSITSDTTGESHIFWTDANGYYSSESGFYAHSCNTNDGEQGSGIWFGLNEEGENVEVDDDLGALPYDTYTVQELECDANEGMTLVSFTVEITRDGYTVKMGTVSDTTVAISTSVEDEDTGMHYAVAGEDTVLVDTVTYSGLAKGKTYTLEAKLMDKDTGTVITDSDGSEISAETEFTAP